MGEKVEGEKGSEIERASQWKVRQEVGGNEGIGKGIKKVSWKGNGKGYVWRGSGRES